MCTVFVKNTSKGMVAARNHSWTQPGGNVYFIPPQRIYGKMANAMYLMDQWGQDRPFEGINEHGVFIGAAGIPDDLSPLGKQKRQPHGMDFCGIIRFVLERAKSTAEALEIFRSVPISYDLDGEPGTVGYNVRNHFLIADPTGHAVNWADEKNCFTRRLSAGKGFHITNFPLSFKAADCNRHPILKKGMADVRGPASAMKLLEKSQQTITLWSCVYDLKRLTMELCIDLDFDFTFRFDFKEKIGGANGTSVSGSCASGKGLAIPGKRNSSFQKRSTTPPRSLKPWTPRIGEGPCLRWQP